MKKDTQKAADFLIAAAVTIISAIFLSLASKMPKSARGIGPGDFPSIICVVLIVLSAAQLIKLIIECRGIPVIDFKGVNVRWLIRALAMMLLAFFYYLLLKKVGFLLLTPLFLFASFVLFGYRKYLKGAIYAIAFSTGVYFLFVKVFLVLLPGGILG